MAGEVYVQRIDGWKATMQWADGGEAGGPVRLVIEPADDDAPPIGGLSSTVLRSVNFQEAADKLSGFFRIAQERNAERDQFTGSTLRELLKESGISPEYLVRLCLAYMDLVRRGRKHPTEYLAELVGKSDNTVKGHLWQAKKKGLFVGSGGRVGGNLTPEGQRIAWELAGLDPDDFKPEA